MCVQVSLLYLDFGPDPKHVIVQYEQNIVNYGENGGKYGSKPIIHMSY